MRFCRAKKVDLACVSRANERTGRTLRGSETKTLLRLQMADVSVTAIVVDAEDVAAIAGDREKAVRAGRQCVDDIVFAGPQFAWRLSLEPVRRFRFLRARTRWRWLPEATAVEPR